ncbi:MAG: DNA-directed DNA polymerase I [Promethearchaeota archaeon]
MPNNASSNSKNIKKSKKSTKKKSKSPSIFDFIDQSADKKITNKNKKTTEKKAPKQDLQQIPQEQTLQEQPEKKQEKEKFKQDKDEKIKTKIQKDNNVKFYTPNETPFGELIFDKKPDYENFGKLSQKSRYLLLLKENGMICENMEMGFLLTVEYDGYLNKAYAKFYDIKEQKIKFWIDNTEHQPYCYHKLSKSELEKNQNLINFEGFDRIETRKIYDLLANKEIEISKIYGKTPSDVAGSRSMTIKSILNGAWEANIRYHHNYIYDTRLIPGLLYKISNGKVELIKSNLDLKLIRQFEEKYKDEPKEFQDTAREYLKLFSYEIPDIKRLALDIEVDVPPSGKLPNPKLARQQIISISFASSDGLNRIYLLWKEGMKLGDKNKDFPENAEIIFFKNEKDLIIETFRLIWEYPLVVTFNGDNFDFNYLFHRANNLKIPKELNPIQLSSSQGMVSTHAYLKYGVHLELFQIFSNRSIKGYAFGGAYAKNSLDDISMAFLNDQKIKHQEGDKAGEKFSALDIAHLDIYTLAYYNLMDSILTLKLTQFNNNALWNLIVYLMRITKLPLQDLIRHQISFWIRNLFYYEHRIRNYLIPRRSEIREKKKGGIGKSIIEGKGFQGAYVIPPVPGIHFNVVVADFSSLYPSIIKTRNLSYETINCNHKDCTSNFLPGTPYYACTKRIGIFALIVGVIRDIRVKWFKPLSSNKNLAEKERSFAKIIQSALKVFINGSYGVFGSENFPLFCLPVAEATTAIGRYAIKETIQKAESMGVKVLYGDTDSVFLANPTNEQVQEIIRWSKEYLKIELEEEKTYQFLALSDRKKNYVGVYKGTKYIDIKGMMGKKSNTPPFIIKAFEKATKILKNISNMDDFEKNKVKIVNLVKNTLKKIGKPVEKGGFPIRDYAVSVILKKHLDNYKKNEPQHVKAAKIALKYNKNLKFEPGDYIEFVKTKSAEGVKPVQFAKIEEIDIEKYKELLRGTFEQLLDALSISFDEIEGVKKLDSFF